VVRRANLLPAETWAALAAPLRGFNAGVWPFLCLEGAWDKSGPKLAKWITKHKYFEVAEQRGWVWRSPGLTQDTLAGFLRDWAKTRGLAFSQAGLAAFRQALPLDAGAVSLELDKVALGLGDRREIGPEDAALVSFQPAIEFFDLLRFLEKGDRAGALKVWRKVADSELGSDELLFPFLGLLVREARVLWQLHHGEPAQIPPFIRAAKEDMARKLGPARLAAIWELALDAEHGVKSGGRNPQQALELLMADLFALFGHRAA
jgi:DNA polymerase-3 subunit delta